MKAIQLPSALFTLNRERLTPRLQPHSVAVFNANDIMPTNADGSMGHLQNADLFYLTGIHQEETMLLLAPDAFDPNHREILFIRQPSEHLAIWEGHKHTKEQATAISGIANVKWLSEFPGIFRQVACEMKTIYLNTNEHQRADVTVETRDNRFVRNCLSQFPLHQYQRLAPLMYELRTVKGQFAYGPIIASGANNNILHYNQNDRTCKKGDLLLLDVAAGLGNYMSDLTRTIPISGKFTRRQKQVYNAVLRIFRHQVAALVPGKTTRDLRLECEEVTAKECVDLGLLKMSQVKKQNPNDPAVRQYFMHGVSHPIGLDVHDATYNHLKIAPGWVLTVEPAIYIKEEGFGVRLENTVLVTENSQFDLMGHIPIEAGEIEDLMHRR